MLSFQFSISVIMPVTVEMNSILPGSNIIFARIKSNTVGSIFPTMFPMWLDAIRAQVGVSTINPPLYEQIFAQNERSFVHSVPGCKMLHATCFARVLNQGVSIYCKHPLLCKFSTNLIRICWWPT